VGQQEESLPVVASTDFSRREHARSNAVAQAFKASGDLRESHVKMADDVLAEHPLRSDLADDPGDVRPEVPRVRFAKSLAGEAERLARVARSEDIHAATPRAAVEGAHVRPERRLVQGFVFHPGHESGRSMCVPLDEANSSVARCCDMQTEFEPASSGAEGESIKAGGMKSHIKPPGAAVSRL
jgi:hypothetical protein